MMRPLCLGLILLVKAQFLYSQNIDWNRTYNWRLYKINSRLGFGYSLDTLHNFKSIMLNNDTVQNYLQSVSVIPLEKTPVWMGAYIASCQLSDGTVRKIEIGKYGGFFFDEIEKKYYELPLTIRKEWLNYLSDTYENIPSTP